MSNTIDFLHTERSRLDTSNKLKHFRLVTSGKGGRTFAVEKIQVRSFSIGKEIDLNIGEAKCHDNESFNKKIGRELAISRMEVKTFKVTRIVYTEKRVDVTLNSENYEVDLSFRSDKKLSRLEHVTKD